MTKEEFNNLKVGTICVIKRGRDQGTKCRVLFKEEESILIKTIDGTNFKAIGINRNVRLTGWHELDIAKDLGQGIFYFIF